MASTPPLQLLSSPQTPSTPLHGAAYERPTRKSSRIKQRVSSQAQAATNGNTITPPRKRSFTSPSSASQPHPLSLSPPVTARKSVRRVQVVSPSSPNTRPAPFKSSTILPQPFSSSTTTFSESMLPTPVKTPKKKSLHNIQPASKALFQDPTTIEEMANSTPQKTRKTKRFNGYSLESFRAEAEDPNGVQVFTDIRDNVPEIDNSPSNPFIDDSVRADGSRTKKIAGTSKRRKVSAAHHKDAQVENAIRQDEGMVYVFRGRKVFRRFEDADEEDEEIDPDDLGLLNYSSGGGKRTRPMRTLTRKSIKPTRLFESQEDKAVREHEKEEEALTEVDERSSEEELSVKRAGDTAEPHKPARNTGKSVDKKTSPFDKWPRLKKGSREGSVTKAIKRNAGELLDISPADEVVEGTKISKRKTRA